MKSDSDLQHDVLEELERDPSIDSSKIGVTAKDGVITLSGTVPRYTEKMTAEELAKSIAGVKAVANDIEVRLPGTGERNDTDIAGAALNALAWNTIVPNERIKVTVRNGWITLEGDVDWQYQRDAARRAVCYLIGVKGVTNQIVIKEKPKPQDIKKDIEAAFKRNAEVHAGRVQVDTRDGAIILNGKVASWSERAEAERVAWAAPGVTVVDNELTIGV